MLREVSPLINARSHWCKANLLWGDYIYYLVIRRGGKLQTYYGAILYMKRLLGIYLAKQVRVMVYHMGVLEKDNLNLF